MVFKVNHFSIFSEQNGLEESKPKVLRYFQNDPRSCGTTKNELPSPHFLLYGTTNLEFISFYWVRRFLSPNGGKNKINFLGTTKFEAQGAHFLLLGTTIIEAKWGQWKKHWPHFVIIGYDDF